MCAYFLYGAGGADKMGMGREGGRERERGRGKSWMRETGGEGEIYHVLTTSLAYNTHARTECWGAAEDSGSRLETRLEVERGYRYLVDVEKNGNSIHPTAPNLDLTHGGFNLSRTVCEVYVICLNSANLIARTPFSKEGFTAAY